MSKRFVTVFNIDNIHLNKDVGLIPYGMYKYHDYDVTIATYNNDHYYMSENNIKGIKLDFIKRITGVFEVDAILYLLKNSKKIDVFNCYHTRISTAIFVRVYRFLHPNGKIYLKLDGGCSKESLSKINQIIFKNTFKKVDLISSETPQKVELLKKSWNEKIEFIPNPFHPEEIHDFRSYKERKNTIITVGRLGTKQKATEILLKAWENIAREYVDWKLILIGPIEKVECNFQNYIDQWKEENSDISSRTIFTGKVSDRNELIELYRTSKIFAFPSRTESFGIAVMEAIVAGTYVVASDIPTNRTLTENFEYGSCFDVDDYNKFALCLKESIDNENAMEIKSRKLYDIALKKYSLENVARTIEQNIND